MPDGYILSEEDVAVLKELLSREKARRGNVNVPSNSRDIEILHQAPEIYIAEAPDAGIPALTPSSGTGNVSHTPGQADCQILSILSRDTAPSLQETGIAKKTIFNLSPNPIVGGDWLLAARDKYGSWLGVPIGGGTNSQPPTILITDVTQPVGPQIPLLWNAGRVQKYIEAGGVWSWSNLNSYDDAWVIDNDGGVLTTIRYECDKRGTVAATITGATNATPIVIAVDSSTGFLTGDHVVVAGVLGNTNANGKFTCTVVDSTHISLVSSAGNAAYISGGVILGRDVYATDAAPAASTSVNPFSYYREKISGEAVAGHTGYLPTFLQPLGMYEFTGANFNSTSTPGFTNGSIFATPHVFHRALTLSTVALLHVITGLHAGPVLVGIYGNVESTGVAGSYYPKTLLASASIDIQAGFVRPFTSCDIGYTLGSLNVSVSIVPNKLYWIVFLATGGTAYTAPIPPIPIHSIFGLTLYQSSAGGGIHGLGVMSSTLYFPAGGCTTYTSLPSDLSAIAAELLPAAGSSYTVNAGPTAIPLVMYQDTP